MLQGGVGGRRVAIVAGCRTPFAKSGTVFRDVLAVDLARHAGRELLERANLDPKEVDEVVFGQVVASPLVPNIAREVSLLPQLPKEVPAYTVNRACASSGQAVTNAADQIARGHADVILAGGVESLSDIPILHTHRMAQIRRSRRPATSLARRLATVAQRRPRDRVPASPAISRPTGGEAVGGSAQKVATEAGSGRKARGQWARRSQRRAAARPADGR